MWLVLKFLLKSKDVLYQASSDLSEINSFYGSFSDESQKTPPWLSKFRKTLHSTGLKRNGQKKESFIYLLNNFDFDIFQDLTIWKALSFSLFRMSLAVFKGRLPMPEPPTVMKIPNSDIYHQVNYFAIFSNW